MNEESRPIMGTAFTNPAWRLVHTDSTPEAVYRNRPLALDTGTSADAAGRASQATLGIVQAAVLSVLREHPGTDEELIVRYNSRGGPRFPKVTDQRLRTARAHLVRDGLVRDSGALAYTVLGNRATCWEVVA